MNDYYTGPCKVIGHFDIDRSISNDHNNYINAFVKHARLKRKEHAIKVSDPIRKKVGLPIGNEGCYFVGSSEGSYKGEDDTIEDRLSPPEGVPGIWCSWKISQKNKIVWKPNHNSFKYQAEWAKYLISHFFSRWKYNVNGQIRWHGNYSNQIGKIVIKDNVVEFFDLSVFA